MKIVLAGLVATAAAAGVKVDHEMNSAFMRFYKEHNKSSQYAQGTEEYFFRMGVFAENVEKAQKLNEEHMLVAGTAVFGVTKFSDLTEEEFASFYLNKALADDSGFTNRIQLADENAPAADIDWRTKGVLTPVKNQMQCGSCWAFSATQTIEAFAKIDGKNLDILAPQQIVSCDKTDSGCNGGWPYKAMEYVHSAGGIELNSDYPYTSGGGRTGTCEVVTSKFAPGIQVVSHVNVQQGESNLAAALSKGPVSICVDASRWSSYRSGVLSTCGTSVDHAVQAVGMTADYWIVRNSWGASWGESGFIRIKRGQNLCLISNYVSYPTF